MTITIKDELSFDYVICPVASVVVKFANEDFGAGKQIVVAEVGDARPICVVFLRVFKVFVPFFGITGLCALECGHDFSGICESKWRQITQLKEFAEVFAGGQAVRPRSGQGRLVGNVFVDLA